MRGVKLSPQIACVLFSYAFCTWYVSCVSTATAAATLGERIAHARQTAGLTQIQLAARAGAAERTVQSWERDERIPRRPALERVAQVTGRALSWFYEEGPLP